MTYRISATTLEAYRLFLTEDWMDYDRLAAQLSGEREETDAMRRGTSLHEILEVPQADREAKFGYTGTKLVPQLELAPKEEDVGWGLTGEEEVPCYRHLGFVWDAASIDRIPASGGINEIKAELPITTGNGDAVLAARADKVLGLAVMDYKTTSNQFEAERYMQSVQWKIYCLAFSAHSFTYRVFEIRDGDVLTIKAAHALTCRPYPGMAEEVQRLAGDFIGFCLRNGFHRAIGAQPNKEQ